MRALAIDPATVSGYAFGIYGQKPMSGTIKLPDAGRPGRRCSHLEGRIRDLITGNKVEQIVVENIFQSPMAKFNPAQVELLHGYRMAIRMACDKSGLDEIRDLIFVTPGAWRKTFGTNEVPDVVRRDSRPDARRKWLKQAAFTRCEELGWEPRNTDESDALGIWAYGESLFMPDFAIERTPLFASL